MGLALKVNKYGVYSIVLIFTSVLINYVISKKVLSEVVIIEHLYPQMDYDRILGMIDLKKKWEWINYLVIPFVYLLKFTVVSLWIICGSILYNKNINFKSVFRIVILAEFVWLIPPVILILWFGIFETNYSYTDIQYFAPLSLLSLFEPASVESWLVYPLKSFNLFEVFYVLILGVGIKKITSKNYMSSLSFIAPVYSSALIVWVIFVTFLTINVIG